MGAVASAADVDEDPPPSGYSMAAASRSLQPPRSTTPSASPKPSPRRSRSYLSAKRQATISQQRIEHQRQQAALDESYVTCGSLYRWFVCCVAERTGERERERSMKRAEPSMSKSKSRRAPISSILLNSQPTSTLNVRSLATTHTSAAVGSGGMSRLRLATTSFTQQTRAFIRHSSATVTSRVSPYHTAAANVQPTSPLQLSRPQQSHDRSDDGAAGDRGAAVSAGNEAQSVGEVEEVQDDAAGESFLRQWREHSDGRTAAQQRRHNNTHSLDQQPHAAHSPHLHPHRYTLPTNSSLLAQASHSHRASYSAHRPSAIRAALPSQPMHLNTTSVIASVSVSPSSRSSGAHTPRSQSHHSHTHYAFARGGGRGDDNSYAADHAAPSPRSSARSTSSAITAQPQHQQPSPISGSPKRQLRANLSKVHPQPARSPSPPLTSDPPHWQANDRSSVPPPGRLRSRSYAATVSVSSPVITSQQPWSPVYSPVMSPSSNSASMSRVSSRPHTPTTLTSAVYLHYTPVGAKQLNQYELIEGGELGRGSYGKVVSVRDVNDGAIYAMKIMSKREAAEAHSYPTQATE